MKSLSSLITLLLTGWFCFGPMSFAQAVIDVADIPLDVSTKSAPANIMFVLDDSGSMDFEMMTLAGDGLFGGQYYVFDDPGDNIYSGARILSNSQRLQWQSQWFGYNRMYYNPGVSYEPWPTLTNADPNHPRSHPAHATPTFDLSSIYVQFGSPVIDIPRAHYYVYSSSESRPYLVVIDGGSISYYAVSVTGSGANEALQSLSLTASPPADVECSRTYIEERQNFANWYSYYRRRELTATAAVSRVIANMAGVQIGIASINRRIIQPVLRIKVSGVDDTATLLGALYDLVLYGNGTPLRRGLQNVGRYYDQNDSESSDDIGVCPYWSSANGGECQQSFAIVMTDGYWNGADPSVGNEDGDDGPPFADSYSRTLADVAMRFWENDLSSSLNNLVPVSPEDSAAWQHMVTYGVSFGVTGTLNPDDYDLSAAPAIPWPNVWSGSAQRIDDLFHASVNGHGIFLSAGDPSELVESLLAIMKNIEERMGSAASVSVNGDQLYEEIGDHTYLFQSTYDTATWAGNISSYKVNSTDGSINTASPEWSVATVWADYDWTTHWNNRAVVTYDGTNGVPFRAADLIPAQLALLDADSTTASEILNYVRGDQSNEKANGGVFRNRDSLLGDIVHSSPVYNKGLLFAGGNDGMLHVLVAEGADAGKDFFSYVPGPVIENLSLLAATDYSHKYYVDLSVSVNDVEWGGSEYTLLVGGLGAGGRGYYALNLTDLTTYNSSSGLWETNTVNETTLSNRVLWEFPGPLTSTADRNDIGLSYSSAQTVQTNSSSYPWVVVVGNGYNSIDGQSVLFILNPADGAVVKKIELGSGPDNGLATPSVVDVNGDDQIDYIYAGDLEGQLWKIDVSSSDIADWDVAYSASGVGVPLFQAVGPLGNAQPITAKPDVMYHPQEEGYMVLFGTGKYLGVSDLSDTSVQTVYGVWDYGDDDDDSEFLGTLTRTNSTVTALSSHSKLLEQTALYDWYFHDPDGDGDGQYIRIMSDHPISWATMPDSNSLWPNPANSVDNHIGWYFDFPIGGERVVTSMLIRDNRAIYVSFLPHSQPCSTGGRSIVNEVDARTGGRPVTVVWDVNDDRFINGDDNVTLGGTTYVVTGLGVDGQAQNPAILRKGDIELKYLSTTKGEISTFRERGVRLGISSWLEF